MDNLGGRRLLQAILTLIGISLLVFSILATSENIGATMLGTHASQEARQALAEQLGLNDSMPIQYVHWLTRMIGGDFGMSLRLHRPVFGIIAARIPSTLELVVASIVITAIVVGGVAVLQHGRGKVILPRIIETLFAATPAFWLGYLLLLIFGVQLRLLPMGGRSPTGEFPPLFGRLEYLVMPALTLSFTCLTYYSKWQRIPETERLRFLSVAFAGLLSNVVIVETVFAWPGVGRLVYDALIRQDIFIISAIVMITSVVVVLFSNVLNALLGKIPFAAYRHSEKKQKVVVGIKSLLSLQNPSTGLSKLDYSTSSIQTALGQLRLNQQPDLSYNRATMIKHALYRFRDDTNPEQIQSTEPRATRTLATGILLFIILAPASISLISTKVISQDYLRPNVSSRFLPLGSPGHIFGTDGLGRDFLVQLLLGAQTTVSIAIFATLVALSIGLVMFFVTDHFGYVADSLVKWLINLINSIPMVPLLSLIASVQGIGFTATVIMLGLVGWIDIALQARTHGISYVRWLSALVTTLGTLMLFESYLSFLGAGSPPPELSLGGISGAGIHFLLRDPQLIIMPGLLLTIIVVCLFVLANQLDNIKR